MDHKLFISNSGIIECECDTAALYGECKHTKSDVVIPWLVAQVKDLRAALVSKQEEIDACHSLLEGAEFESFLPEHK